MIYQEKVYKGADGREALYDYTFEDTEAKKPLVLFIHGFKGFKDWGAFPLVSNEIAQKGYIAAKINLSHNGTTIDQPVDFADLEAFGRNTFSKEFFDVKQLLDLLLKDAEIIQHWNGKDVVLIGHSRGGGLAMLYAAHDSRVTQVVTWAAVADLESRFTQNQIDHWLNEGVIYIPNARTNQEMPLYSSLIDDFKANEPLFNIQRAVEKLEIPQLIIHGTNDETVNVSDAEKIAQWNPNAEQFIIVDADHTFGAKQPLGSDVMPEFTKLALNETLQFIKVSTAQ